MDKMIMVNFKGDKLTTIVARGDVFVAVKPLVKAMGLAWQGQLERLKRSPILREGISVILIPSGRSGGLQKTVCLKLSLLNGWLFTIDSNRIKNQFVRNKVVLYQRECFEVLWRYFSGQRSVPSSAPNPPPRSSREESLKIRIIHEVRMTFGRRPAAELWFKLGMPRAPGMANAFAQLELFDQGGEAA